MMYGPWHGNLEDSAIGGPAHYARGFPANTYARDYGGLVRPRFPGLLISQNPQLDAISMPVLARVEGDLSIQNNAALTSLASFGALTSLSGSLIIEDNRALVSVDGLLNLQAVTGPGATIARNPALKSIRLANLKTLGASGGSYQVGVNNDYSGSCWSHFMSGLTSHYVDKGKVVRQAFFAASAVLALGATRRLS